MTDKIEKQQQCEKALIRLDIAKKVKKETGLPLAVSSDVVRQLFDHISDALSQGDDVKLAGFGTFKLRRKKPRLGRNPKTGKECIITARTVLTFSPSAVMRERIQSSLEAPMIPTKEPLPLKSRLVPEQKVRCGSDVDKTPKVRRSQWIALFELLGLLAFADSSFNQDISKAFSEEVIELKFLIEPSAAITRKSMVSWMRLNQKKMLNSLETDTFDSRFQKNLTALQGIPHKTDIIFSMLRIAIANDTYGDFEKSIISQTILKWDMSSKDMEDIENMFPDVIPGIIKALSV